MGDDLAHAGVDRADDRLGAELVRERGEQTGVVDGGAVQRHLVGPGAEQRAGVLEPGDAAADGERDLQLLGGAFDQLEQRPAALERRGDVEEDELVGAELRVARRELDRVAHVAQVLEADALDDAAAGDVEARDHALLDHATAFLEEPRAGRAAALGMELDAGDGAVLDGGDDRAVVVDLGHGLGAARQRRRTSGRSRRPRRRGRRGARRGP